MYVVVLWKNLSTDYTLIAPNTTLRSRVLGKMLLPRFPSSLPPLTVLDCILDVNWKDNGIIHVLDVLKWKGQDVCDCETPFRCIYITRGRPVY
jgi:snurportin-1